MRTKLTESGSKTLLAAIFVLFLLQLITDFVASIYALNLLAFSLSSADLAALYLTAPEQAEAQVMREVVGNILTSFVLLSPLMLLFFKKKVPRALMIVLAEVAVICRVIEPQVPTKIRMYVSGIGVACLLLIIPLYFCRRANKEGQESLSIGIGVALAVMLSILFKTIGSGIDISSHDWSQAITWVLAGTAAVLIPGTTGKKGLVDADPRFQPKPAGAGKIMLLCLGLIACFALLYFALSAPGVIARWTEGSYILITCVLTAVLALFIAMFTLKPDIRFARWLIWLWNVVFVLVLFLTVSVHKTQLPLVESAYPLSATATTGLQQIPLFLMLLLSPVIVLDMIVLSRELGAALPSIRKLGLGFSVACLFFLLAIFAIIFTLIWDYVPGLGPVFRDRIDLVFLITGLAAALPLLCVKSASAQFKQTGARRPLALIAAGVIAGTTLMAAVITEAPPALRTEETPAVKVLTYNIQTGYNSSGYWNFDGQLNVLRAHQPDIIGLQESDTCRITGGNTDVVRFLANRLNYHSYFGPKTVTGTFGIALLSRYPIDNPRTLYLYSEGEQAAAIEAKIRIGVIEYRVFVTHLGNYGPLEQQKNILRETRGKRHVILMGDFNFKRDTEQYAITTIGLEDCRQSVEGGDLQNDDIDYVFVSPGTYVKAYQQVGGKNSDHPAVMVTIQQ